MKKFTRDDTEHGKEYYLASDVDALLVQPEQEPVASNCTHEWIDDTKAKPAWRCIKCGSDYTKEKA